MDLRESIEPAVTSGGPSVSASFEHLVASSQGVVTKHIDLALLEGRELLTRSLYSAALIGLAVATASAAWFAAAAALVLLATPPQGWALRLGAFALINVAAAIALIASARRQARPPAPRSADGEQEAAARAVPRAQPAPWTP